ncbi:hypothetical protein [Oceanobacillus kimchii]|uniref:hypothetical protein n=1 Tax=Oceanobacillus kimchii TaxID=746691 RepID=UPI003B014321
MADKLDLVCSQLLVGKGPIAIYSDRKGNSKLATIAVLEDSTIEMLKREFPYKKCFYVCYKDVYFELV